MIKNVAVSSAMQGISMTHLDTSNAPQKTFKAWCCFCLALAALTTASGAVPEQCQVPRNHCSAMLRGGAAMLVALAKQRVDASELESVPTNTQQVQLSNRLNR